MDVTSPTQSAAMSHPLLSVTDVARRLGVTPRTVRRLLSMREIPYVQLTRTCRRVAEADLAAFIQDRTRRSTSTPDQP